MCFIPTNHQLAHILLLQVSPVSPITAGVLFGSTGCAHASMAYAVETGSSMGAERLGLWGPYKWDLISPPPRLVGAHLVYTVHYFTGRRMWYDDMNMLHVNQNRSAVAVHLNIVWFFLAVLVGTFVPLGKLASLCMWCRFYVVYMYIIFSDDLFDAIVDSWRSRRHRAGKNFGS